MFDNTKKQSRTSAIGNAIQSKECGKNKISAFSFGETKKTIQKKETTKLNHTAASQSWETRKNVGVQKNEHSYIPKTKNTLLGKEYKDDKNDTMQKKGEIPSSIASNNQQNIMLSKSLSSQSVRQDNLPRFEYSGNKSNDLINCVLIAIQSWKNHYNLSIPDDVLMDQVLTLFNQLREINR